MPQPLLVRDWFDCVTSQHAWNAGARALLVAHLDFDLGAITHQRRLLEQESDRRDITVHADDTRRRLDELTVDDQARLESPREEVFDVNKHLDCH
jgi:hypothetical protein